MLVERSADCVIDMCPCSKRSGYRSGQGRIRPPYPISPACASRKSRPRRLCSYIIQPRRYLLRQDLCLSLHTATPAVHPEILPLVSIALVPRVTGLYYIFSKFREDHLHQIGASTGSCYSSPSSQFLPLFFGACNASQSAESGIEM